MRAYNCVESDEKVGQFQIPEGRANSISAKSVFQEPNKISKVPMTAAMETVRPAAINPDSIAVVLFTKRMMGPFMFRAPLSQGSSLP